MLLVAIIDLEFWKKMLLFIYYLFDFIVWASLYGYIGQRFTKMDTIFWFLYATL